MARPAKNYCDYFPHDRDMRNHRKVKAIRNKFTITGYAIWSMLLEYLTGTDGNEFEYSDAEFELIAGDFGVPAEEIKGVVDYAITLELLFNKDGFIHSESLDERLKPVYEKREISKSRSKKQLRSNGKFVHTNTDGHGVSVTEIPQKKVNEKELNNKKVNKKDFKRNRKTKAGAIANAKIKIEGKMFLPEDVGDLPEVKIKSSIELLKITSQQIVTSDDVVAMWGIFKIQNLTGKKWYNSIEDVESHFMNWVKGKNFKKELNGRGVQKSNASVGKTFTPD